MNVVRLLALADIDCCCYFPPSFSIVVSYLFFLPLRSHVFADLHSDGTDNMTAIVVDLRGSSVASKRCGFSLQNTFARQSETTHFLVSRLASSFQRFHALISCQSFLSPLPFPFCIFLSFVLVLTFSLFLLHRSAPMEPQVGGSALQPRRQRGDTLPRRFRNRQASAVEIKCGLSQRLRVQRCVFSPIPACRFTGAVDWSEPLPSTVVVSCAFASSYCAKDGLSYFQHAMMPSSGLGSLCTLSSVCLLFPLPFLGVKQLSF